MLSSEGFHLMCHPAGTMCLHGVPTKPKYASLIGNVNYLGFSRKHIRALLGLCYFVHFQKHDEEEKREGKSSVETINIPLCCWFLISPEFFGLVIFPFPFSCNSTGTHVTSYLYVFAHLHNLTCCALLSPLTCFHATISLKTWLENGSRNTYQTNSTHSDDAFTQSSHIPLSSFHIYWFIAFRLF